MLITVGLLVLMYGFWHRRSPSSTRAAAAWRLGAGLLIVSVSAASALSNNELKARVQEWTDNRAVAEQKYGPIEDWDVSKVTSLSSSGSATAMRAFIPSDFNGDLNK